MNLMFAAYTHMIITEKKEKALFELSDETLIKIDVKGYQRLC